MVDTDILKLTDAKINQASFALYTTPVDATKGLSITFDFFSYGGSSGLAGGTDGGDGIGFLLVDGAQSPAKPGGFGGSLGYAQRLSTAGIVGGYLGVGFDEFGLYSDGQEGRTGGIGRIPDAIAVRGSQATGYKYLTGTTASLPLSLDNPGSQATRENSRRRAQVDLTPTGLLTVQIDLNNDGDFLDPGEKPINAFDVVGVGGNGALPTTFKFGFAASTGAATNIHEVGNFKVATSDGTPLPGDFRTGLLIIGSETGATGVLTGTTGGDTIVSGGGSTSTGNAGADRFTFAGASKAAALKRSTVSKLSKVTDFNFAQNDRFQLDFDNNLNTAQLPKGLSYAGKITTRNLTEAAKLAYADKSSTKRGKQALKGDEAVFFKLGSRTYLSVNDGKAAFAAKFDLVADVTGIQFKTGDVKKASLSVSNYFV
jgi:serralysin